VLDACDRAAAQVATGQREQVEHHRDAAGIKQDRAAVRRCRAAASHRPSRYTTSSPSSTVPAEICGTMAAAISGKHALKGSLLPRLPNNLVADPVKGQGAKY